MGRTAFNRATRKSPYDDARVKVTERLPGVEEAEGRVAFGNMSIMLGPDKKQRLAVTAVRDLSTLRIDQLRLLDGDWPGRMEMLVVNLKTIDSFGLPRAFNRLPLRVSGDDPTEANARAAGRDIECLFSRNDKMVFQSLVRSSSPNQHPAITTVAVNALSARPSASSLTWATCGTRWAC